MMADQDMLLEGLDVEDMPPEKKAKLVKGIDGYLRNLAQQTTAAATANFSSVMDEKLKLALQQTEMKSMALIGESEKRMAARLAQSETETRELISVLSSTG